MNPRFYPAIMDLREETHASSTKRMRKMMHTSSKKSHIRLSTMMMAMLPITMYMPQVMIGLRRKMKMTLTFTLIWKEWRPGYTQKIVHSSMSRSIGLPKLLITIGSLIKAKARSNSLCRQRCIPISYPMYRIKLRNLIKFKISPGYKFNLRVAASLQESQIKRISNDLQGLQLEDALSNPEAPNIASCHVASGTTSAEASNAITSAKNNTSTEASDLATPLGAKKQMLLDLGLVNFSTLNLMKSTKAIEVHVRKRIISNL